MFSSEFWKPPTPLKPSREVLKLDGLVFDYKEIVFLFSFLALLNIYRSAHSLALLLPQTAKARMTRIIFTINIALVIILTVLFPCVLPLAVISVCYMIGIDKENLCICCDPPVF
jgi:hypothetical protein